MENIVKTEGQAGRDLKHHVFDLLKSPDFEGSLKELSDLPPRLLINSLISALCRSEEQIRWQAVTAMGIIVKRLAEKDMEGARIIMRRLMWSLNEESGGIGWGAPEAMGEIMACHEGLAKEYGHILISYIKEGANFLKHESLQRGVIWGLGRLAQVRPHLVQDALPSLYPYIRSEDPILRGLAAWIMGLLGHQGTSGPLKKLLKDKGEFRLYVNREFVPCRVSDLAERALAALDKRRPLLKEGDDKASHL